MKINELQLSQLIGALQRLQLQDIKGPVRYAITRTLQVVMPLWAATVEAFPEPQEPQEREAWTKTLQAREVEFTPVTIPFPPDVDDKLFESEQRQQRAAAKDGDPAKSWTDEMIQFSRIQRNQTIMESILPLIKDPA